MPWLTPDSIPEGGVCRPLFIPADGTWLALVSGALTELTKSYNWEKFGALTVEETIAQMQTIVDNYYTASCVSEIVDAPFWDEDSGDDADDTATPDDQTWYGTWDGETFLETVSYVFLTSFLSTLVSPDAAIKFLTIPRAFRVLIRQNPHGANLLLFLDGGLFKVINGYSPFDKIAEFLISSPGTELMLVHAGTHDEAATPDGNGNYVVDVVRQRLDAHDVTPVSQRVNPSTMVWQTSPDNGTIWNDNSAADPRTNPAYLLPHLTPYSGLKCDGAARMTAQLKDTLDIFIASGDAAQSITGWLALLVFPLGVVGWLLDALIALADLLIDNGQAAIEAAFTDTVWESIECSFYCGVDSNGRISKDHLDAAYEEIKANHTGLIATVIDELRFFFGDVPMSNAVVVRDETGDCSGCNSCDWCTTMNAVNGWEGVESLKWVSNTGTAASYDGSKWNNGLSGDGRARVVALKFSGLAAKHVFQFICYGSVSGWHFKRDCTGNDYVNTGTEFTPRGDGNQSSGWDAPGGTPVEVTSAVYVYRFTVDVTGNFSLAELKMQGHDGVPPYVENCP
jgi:hypothetical protein